MFCGVFRASMTSATGLKRVAFRVAIGVLFVVLYYLQRCCRQCFRPSRQVVSRWAELSLRELYRADRAAAP